MSATLFVRNLAYTTTDKSLSDAFAAVGPIRSGFVVNGRDGKPRGIGFVEFSLAGDAQTALRSMQNKQIDGRAVKLEIAKKRESLKEGQRRGAPKRAPPDETARSETTGSDAGRSAEAGAAAGRPAPVAAAAGQPAASDRDAKKKLAKRNARLARKEAKTRKAKRHQAGTPQDPAAARAGPVGKPQSAGKEGRLIVRNLAFQVRAALACTESQLLEPRLGLELELTRCRSTFGSALRTSYARSLGSTEP